MTLSFWRWLALPLLLWHGPLAATELPPPGRISVLQGQGLAVESGDGQTALQLAPRLQLRSSWLPVADNWRNETQLRTVRLWMRGRHGGSEAEAPVVWAIQLAFGGKDYDSDSASPVFDAFVRWRLSRDVQVQAGQWFVPLDRARTNREFALQLVDRTTAVRELTLDRDTGVALLSDDLGGFGGKLVYRLGVFGGEDRNRFAEAGYPKGLLGVARLEWRPFGAFDADIENDASRKPELRAALGAAGAYAKSAVRNRGTTGASLVGDTVDYAWGAVDATVKWQGISLLAELLMREQVGDSTAQGRSSNAGAIVQAGAMVTDHLELAERWARIWVREPNETARQASPLNDYSGHEVGLGANWYFDGHRKKLQLDWQKAWNVGGGQGMGGDDGRHVVRLAFDLTP